MNRLSRVLMMALMIGFSTNLASADEPEIQSEGDMLSVTSNYFRNLEKYRSGDLITTGDVEPLVRQLKEKGWDVPDSDQLMSRLISSGSFLDRTLSSKKGQEFFRKISTVAGGADRLERMSKLKNGKVSINQLINFPNGSDLVKDMATTRAGRNLGNRGSRKSGVGSLNKSTGKIYTEKELLVELKRRYQEDTAQNARK